MSSSMLLLGVALMLPPFGASTNWKLDGKARFSQNLTVWHVLQPKFTGVSEKDTGDYLGDVKFILMSFGGKPSGNPEACMTCTVLEQVSISWDGDLGKYLECNVNDGKYTCNKQGDGRVGTRKENGGHWYSFPKVGEGIHWTQEAVQRRFKTTCLGEAWRKAAGGCGQCGSVAEDGKCVGQCVGGMDKKLLKQTWDKVMADHTLCPNEPFRPTPSPSPPHPAPTPKPTPTPTPSPKPTPPSPCTSENRTCEAPELRASCCEGLKCQKKSGKHICIGSAQADANEPDRDIIV